MSPATAPGVRLPAYSILNAAGLRLRTGVAGCILSMGCGALAVLAFAPFNLYPLAVFSLLVLFWLLGSASKRRAFLLGFLFGATEFGFGVYWLYISIHDIANAPLWLTLPIIGALVAVMALYSACACSLGVWLTPVAGWRRWILVLPAVWTLLEWLRGWLLTGFPWLSLGYSQIDSWLRGYAPLAGVYGVSLTVALSAGLLLSVLNKQSIARTRIVFLGLLLALWCTGGALTKVQWTRPSGKPFEVSLLQGNIPSTIKWAPQTFQPTLDLYRRMTEANWSSRLIVWPESALPDYADLVWNDYLEPLEKLAIAHGTELFIGAPTEDPATGAAYNSVLGLGRNQGLYNKQHLVPLSEYFPLPDWARHWLASMDLPYSSFTPGSKDQPLLRAAGYPVGVSICYEDAYGNEIMRALPQAAFLVNVSDDGWFGDSIALPQHFEIARMRSLETGRYLLRDTNTGITAIITARGRVAKSLPRNKQAALQGMVVPYAGSTPYRYIGNGGVVICCCLLLAAGLWWRMRKSTDAGI
ncbi:MAG: apolipoprotein N-acyltransferase [Gammaproteobacteria bacterium]|nr:apolipoprotein N-acyltransferase [Gammaproteobacteria bacterium]